MKNGPLPGDKILRRGSLQNLERLRRTRRDRSTDLGVIGSTRIDYKLTLLDLEDRGKRLYAVPRMDAHVLIPANLKRHGNSSPLNSS